MAQLADICRGKQTQLLMLRGGGTGQLASAEHAAQAAEAEARDARALLAKNEADLEGLSDAYNALEAANARLESQAQQRASSGEMLRSPCPARRGLANEISVYNLGATPCSSV